ncbi:hypothetical protein [Candidatus Palauibacter sp.]|uniref:hypothetical protein n=1 Tax=Candidatus Palauibacter sp. TaxID=3101350 RepID=UPI003B0258F2
MKSLGDPSLLRQIGGGRSPPLKTADRILAFISEWLRPLLVGLSLFLGISGGSWATMHWLWRSIELRIETLATLNRQIEEARWTLAEIEDTTWGVTLREIDGERFVVLPAGSLAHPPWTVRGRRSLAKASRAARRAGDTLGRGLRDDRRDVARALEVIRQPGLSGDLGPSR